jgi:NOL1/NOP2/sun family putative RNA methylase
LSHTLAYFLGHFQYQGASSHIPVLLLDPKPGERILDMAAAPGSKSTQITALMQNRGELVLNDWSHQRLQALNANLQRSGAINYYVLNLRGESLGNLLPEYFDKILLDAPCSALGTLAGSGEIHNWWREERLNKLVKTQFHLLVAALKALKPGGECVYSTCSIAPEENEVLIEKLCNSYPVEIIEPPVFLANQFSKGRQHYEDHTFSRDQKKAIRIWPQVHGYEGFYAVKLRKMDSLGEKKKRENVVCPTHTMDDTEVRDIISQISEEWGVAVTHFESYRYKLTKNRIWMTGADVFQYLNHNFVWAGLLLAERKLHGWKIASNSSQVLNRLISKKIITPDDEQLKQLFANGVVYFEGLKPGYYVFQYKKNIIGTVYTDGRQIKTRLPHSFDLKLK